MNKFVKFGSLLAFVVPLITVVSCGLKDMKTPNSLVEEDLISEKFDIASPLKVDGKVVDVQEDGIYLSKKDYKDGEIWNNKTIALGEESSKDFVPLQPITSVAQHNGALMLGDGDAIYVLYDKDDSDKMTPNTFLDNIFFNDTSVAQLPEIQDSNKKLGSTDDGIKFIASTNGQSGKLAPYLGSQNNHMTGGQSASGNAFNEAILNLQKTLSKTYPDSLQKILDYYGVMINSSGKVVENPIIAQHASWAFAPVFSATPIFTYVRVAQNAYKITYHFDSNARITAAYFTFLSTDGDVSSLDTTSTQMGNFGTLSLGDKQEWDSYVRHADTKYQALKNIYITK